MGTVFFKLIVNGVDNEIEQVKSRLKYCLSL